MLHEVWAEFGDGSVAKYGVVNADLPGLLTQIRNNGIPCMLWVDGQIWEPCDEPEASNSKHCADKISI